MDQQLLAVSALPVSRRTLLKLLVIGAMGGLVGYSRFIKPQPSIHQQDSLALPYCLGRTKSVVVVGGGLAGLACAYELSRRGFTVTLIEKTPQLGGKVASWKIQVGKEEFVMEHGFHGFFPQYYNLNRLVEELNIAGNFQSLHFYSLVFRQDYLPEIFRPSRSAFPWNVVDLAIASSNRWRWGIDLANFKHLKVFGEITGFRIPSSFERLDDISVAEWAANNFPRGLYDLYLLPFARASFNAPDQLSASELLQFFHFYFFGNPEGLAFKSTRQDMGTSLVQPISEAIVRQGGEVIADATVTNLDFRDGKIAALTYEQGQQGSPFWVERNLHLDDEQLEYYGAGDAVYAVLAQERAISLKCTHRGCTVKRQADGNFVCPCHGALYDSQGRVLRGPAQQGLSRLQVLKRQKQSVQLAPTIAIATPAQRTIAADYYVFATDVPGVKQLFRLVPETTIPELAQQVEWLQVADPFAVARFWFDRDFAWEHSYFTSLSGYSLTDSITLYHRIQQQFIDWAKRTGGSVVELHAYCYKESEFPTQAALLATFEQELYEIVPELAQAKLLHRELVNQKNFSGYPLGSYQHRPVTETEVENLFFAGDWVKMPFPCELMERAVSSGLLAANSIMYREGLQRRTLFSVHPRGFFLILDCLNQIEIKIDWGLGYRIYLAQEGKQLIVLFGGGTKKSQQSNIDRAKELYQEYKRRKKKASEGKRTEVENKKRKKR